MPHIKISPLPRWVSAIAASLGIFAVGTAVSSSVVLERPATPTLSAAGQQPTNERPSFLSALPDITEEKLDAGTLVASTESEVEPAPFELTAGVQQVAMPVAPAAEVEAEVPAPETFVVTSQGLNVRSGPSSGSGPLFVLLQGEQVQISEVDGNWARIQSASGESGWAYAKYLAPTTPG